MNHCSMMTSSCMCPPPAFSDLYSYLTLTLSTQTLPLGALVSFNSELDTVKSPERRESQARDYRDQIGLCAWLQRIFLIVNWNRTDQPTEDGTIAAEVVLGSMRKLSLHLLSMWASQQAALVHDLCPGILASVPTLTSLSDGLWPGSINQINPFLP